MSGTFIRDPELLNALPEHLGPLSRLKAVASLPSLALLTVAAVIKETASKEGFDCRLEYLQCPDISCWDESNYGFDLVAISSYTAQIHQAYELAARFRASGALVVLGGTHVSMLPDETISRGFTAAIGEAELVWPAILKDAYDGQLKASYGSLGEVCEITKSPLPAYELLNPASFNRIPVQTSRGCPHRCEFCAASVLYSPKHRQKTVAQVVDELDAVLRIWPRPFIEFVDDNALVDRKYWKSLLKELNNKRLRWFAECDISVGQDDELLALMQESGCREVLIGLESPLSSDLQGLELNANWKQRMHSGYRASLRNIQDHGIAVIGCFMLGLDQQHPDASQLIYEFLRETELFDVQITLQTAFPGTPLYSRLEKENRLKTKNDWDQCTLFDLNIIPALASEDHVVDEFRTLLKKVHSNDETSWRWHKFKQRLRKNRLRAQMQPLN